VLLDLDVVFHPELYTQPYLPEIGPDDLPPDWRDWFGERLAIMAEQCNGPAPEHLRVIALTDTLDAMRRAGEWPMGERRF
jgi:hypothetical protein